MRTRIFLNLGLLNYAQRNFFITNHRLFRRRAAAFHYTVATSGEVPATLKFIAAHRSDYLVGDVFKFFQRGQQCLQFPFTPADGRRRKPRRGFDRRVSRFKRRPLLDHSRLTRALFADAFTCHRGLRVVAAASGGVKFRQKVWEHVWSFSSHFIGLWAALLRREEVLSRGAVAAAPLVRDLILGSQSPHGGCALSVETGRSYHHVFNRRLALALASALASQDWLHRLAPQLRVYAPSLYPNLLSTSFTAIQTAFWRSQDLTFAVGSLLLNLCALGTAEFGQMAVAHALDDSVLRGTPLPPVFTASCVASFSSGAGRRTAQPVRYARSPLSLRIGSAGTMGGFSLLSSRGDVARGVAYCIAAWCIAPEAVLYYGCC